MAVCSEYHTPRFSGWFTPARLAFVPEMNILDKMLLVQFEALARREQGCTATNAYLASAFGVSERTITSAVARLQERALITASYSANNYRTVRLTEQGRSFWKADLEPGDDGLNAPRTDFQRCSNSCEQKEEEEVEEESESSDMASGTPVRDPYSEEQQQHSPGFASPPRVPAHEETETAAELSERADAARLLTACGLAEWQQRDIIGWYPLARIEAACSMKVRFGKGPGFVANALREEWDIHPPARYRETSPSAAAEEQPVVVENAHMSEVEPIPLSSLPDRDASFALLQAAGVSGDLYGLAGAYAFKRIDDVCAWSIREGKGPGFIVKALKEGWILNSPQGNAKPSRAYEDPENRTVSPETRAQNESRAAAEIARSTRDREWIFAGCRKPTDEDMKSSGFYAMKDLLKGKMDANARLPRPPLKRLTDEEKRQKAKAESELAQFHDERRARAGAEA